jgi:error-prone DNA polymerase
LGVPLFQEQAMKVAMVGAGFTADEADKLRRAMAAWRKSGMIEKFHEKIVEGMLRNGYTREFAEQCFLQIRGFGEYGFPESHAASFALLVYVSAWLKRYHPAAFCAALLNSQPMGFYAPAQLVRDAREHGVEVRPADVNCSEWDCLLEPWGRGDAGTWGRDDATSLHPDAPTSPPSKETWGHGGPAVRLGLRLIKGLHVAHAQRVVEVRKQGGPFASVAQFHRRTRLPRHAVQRLAEADAFSSMGLSRRQALWQALALDDQEAPLFEGVEEAEASSDQTPLPRMTLGREVRTDYATAGLSLKKHPVALVRSALSRRDVITAAELQNTPNGHWVRVAGLVLIRQRPGTASGIVFETLEDETGSMNLIVRPDVYDRYRVAARHAALAQADGWVERQGQVVHVMVKRMHDLSALLEEGFEIKSRDFH